MSKLGVEHTAPHHITLLRYVSVRVYCAVQGCAVHHSTGRWEKQEEMRWMKKSAHSVPLVRGTGAGLGVGRRVWVSVWPRSWHYTPTFPLCLNCFKLLSRQKKEIWSTLSPNPPWRKCYRHADGIQRNKTRGKDRATDGQEDVSQTESMSQTDVQTHRERQTGELLEGVTGSSPGYINSSSSGLNLLPAS